MTGSKLFVLLILLMFFSLNQLFGCGGSGGDMTGNAPSPSETPPTTVTMNLSPDRSVSVSVYNSAVYFPAGSVSKATTCTGSVSMNINPVLPVGVKTKGLVYSYTLADPTAYAGNAVITLPIIEGDVTGNNIYTDHGLTVGYTWYKLNSTTSGNTVSATIDGFSNFVIGTLITTPVPETTY